MVNLEIIHLRIFCFAHASIVMVKVWARHFKTQIHTIQVIVQVNAYRVILSRPFYIYSFTPLRRQRTPFCEKPCLHLNI